MNKESHDNRNQAELSDVWKEVKQKYERGRMTESEIQDWELARRISAASEDDTTERRVLMSQIDYETDIQFAKLQEDHSGQTEEQFNKEQEDAQSRYVKTRDEARRRAFKKYGGQF